MTIDLIKDVLGEDDTWFAKVLNGDALMGERGAWLDDFFRKTDEIDDRFSKAFGEFLGS